jgi:RNA polymerase sigma factor (sigma-70 family)
LGSEGPEVRHRALNVLRQSRIAMAAGAKHVADDGDLLARFVAERDEAAFSALVYRHGPMVLGVCRRLLAHRQDAEDAFQATFLVLARKAAAIRHGEVLASWLHGVARRTALRLRARSSRRGTERLGDEEPIAPGAAPSAALREAMQVVDEELARLPAHYRAPLVLCYLDGRTQDEAAVQLGWTVGAFRGRLERGRDMLRKRLTRRGVNLSAALIGLGLDVAPAPAAQVSAAVSAALRRGGHEAGASAVPVQVAEGVCRAMVIHKIRGAGMAAGLAILTTLGGMALVPGVGGPARTAAVGSPPKSDAAPIDQLVRHLGHARFAEREEAEKALTHLGARAATAVRAGMADTDAEIARRCTALWPRLWQAEIARPDADRLAGYTHPLWARFRKAAGDDPGSRTLFAEMAADFNRFRRLEGVEANPETAGAAYAAELKQRAEALERGYREAAEAAGRMSGPIVPARSAYPTRSEFVTLLFLGTYPATARDEGNVYSPVMPAANPAALRRLFTTWLRTRTDPHPIATGLSQALHHNLPEVVPLARAHAANDKLTARARGFALLVVGLHGTPTDLPLLEKAFADSRVFHTTKYTGTDRKERPVEVQVSDVAFASALQLYGQPAADLGYPYLEMYKKRGSDALAQYHLLGFSDGDTRRAVHQKAIQWLREHKDDKPKTMKAQTWESLFDGKTTAGWKTEGQVSVDGSILRIGGDGKGGSITSNATFARGRLRWSVHHAGDAKATITWRGEEHRILEVRQGWTTYGIDPAAPGESRIRVVVPPGTTLEIRDFDFMWY